MLMQAKYMDALIEGKIETNREHVLALNEEGFKAEEISKLLRLDIVIVKQILEAK